jgi:hypothetical protein
MPRAASSLSWNLRPVALARAAIAAVLLLGVFGLTAPTSKAEVPAKTDILLLFDTTGSMGSALASAAAQVNSMTANIDTRLPDVQYGVAEVRDYPLYDSGGGDGAYPYKVNQPITGDRGAVTAAINALTADGGGDGPEAYGGALYAATVGVGFGWRPGARRLVVLVADNVPHDDDLNLGIPADQQTRTSPWNTKVDPGPDGVAGTADDIDWQPLLDAMAYNGVSLAYVLFQGNSSYLPYWNIWAARTGGAAISASDTDLGAKIADVAAAGATKDLPTCPSGGSRDAAGVCDPRHPTGVRVQCNRGPNPGDSSICTVTVGDGSGTETPTSPTGKVKFTALNGGGFAFGDTCSLVPTPGSPSVSSCSVKYIPKTGSWEFPDIVADYAGSEKHQPSSSRTSLIFGRVLGLDGKTVVTEGGPGTADQCKAAATAATGAVPKGGAKASLQAHYPGNKPGGGSLGDWVSHCTWSLVSNVGVLGGYVVQGAALPAGVATTVGAGAIAVVDPEPATKVFFGASAIPAGASVTYGTYKVGEAVVEMSERELRDPPDKKYKATVKPKKVKKVRVVVKRKKDRKRAAVLRQYLTRQQKIAALADALGATLDKAGGAQLAGNTAYVGKQMRRARSYSRSMTIHLIAQRKQAKAAGRAVKLLPGVNVKFSKKTVAKMRKQLTSKKRKLSKSERRRAAKAKRQVNRNMAALGIGSKDRKTLVKWAKSAASDKTVEVPKDLADMVGGRDALRQLDLQILSQRYYLVEPSVLAASRLK